MNTYPGILVVDDDENDLRMVAGVLARSGDPSAVGFVHDGAEALDYLHCRGSFAERPPGLPGLILLDLHMPRVNGWELLRQLKDDARLGTVPVVIFSSSAREADVEQSYELGANAYVVKPINFDLFQQTVRAIEAFWLNCNLAAPVPRAKAATPLPPRRLPRPRFKPESA